MPGSRRAGKVLDVVLVVVNIIVLLGTVGLLFRKDGVGRRLIEDWLATRRQVAVLREAWPAYRDGSSRIGTGDGRITVVEFSDYQCPYCRRAQEIIDSALVLNPSVNIGYRHLPLPSHPLARSAAKVAICAESQNHFSAVNHLLLTTSEWQVDTNWVRLVQAAGITDTISFTSCLASAATTGRLNADIALATQLGIDGTPTFVGPAKVHSGVISIEDLTSMLKGNK